jgi:hypothetical protein
MDMLNLLSTGNGSGRRAWHASKVKWERWGITTGYLHRDGLPKKNRGLIGSPPPKQKRRISAEGLFNQRHQPADRKVLSHPRAAEMFDADESDRDRP